MPPNRDDETIDDLLHGELKLIQPRRGYRYSVDALLLAHFALPLTPGEAVLDLGAGTGVVALILAARGRPKRVVGVEAQPGLFALARRNAEANRERAPVEMVFGDALSPGLELGPGPFGLVVTNPPFRPIGTGQVSPNLEKARAKHEALMTLPAWLEAGRRRLGPDGKIAIVYPVNQEERLWRTAAGLGLGVARRAYAVDRPGGARKLVLAELRPGPAATAEQAEIPIETEAGKFSLDGYR